MANVTRTTTKATAALARSITWASSKQAYVTARLLADRDLADDCLRAYAYFRWADDAIDLALSTRDERLAFIRGQGTLAEMLYRKERPADLSPQEEMLADLIQHDRGAYSGLRSFIHNFLAVLEFDADRKGRLATTRELAAYSSCLGTAVMDGLQYFIGNGHPYRKNRDRELAVGAAHITHMLRDMLDDLPAGFVNIPMEDLEARGISFRDVDSESFRDWVRERVILARRGFEEGKRYIDSLEVLRCKLAGYLYCARFERVLFAIEREDCRLQPEYRRLPMLMGWSRMAGLAMAVTLRHYARRLRRTSSTHRPRVTLGPKRGLRSYPSD